MECCCSARAASRMVNRDKGSVCVQGSARRGRVKREVTTGQQQQGLCRRREQKGPSRMSSGGPKCRRQARRCGPPALGEWARPKLCAGRRLRGKNPGMGPGVQGPGNTCERIRGGEISAGRESAFAPRCFGGVQFPQIFMGNQIESRKEKATKE